MSSHCRSESPVPCTLLSQEQKCEVEKLIACSLKHLQCDNEKLEKKVCSLSKKLEKLSEKECADAKIAAAAFSCSEKQIQGLCNQVKCLKTEDCNLQDQIKCLKKTLNCDVSKLNCKVSKEKSVNKKQECEIKVLEKKKCSPKKCSPKKCSPRKCSPKPCAPICVPASPCSSRAPSPCVSQVSCHSRLPSPVTPRHESPFEEFSDVKCSPLRSRNCSPVKKHCSPKHHRHHSPKCNEESPRIWNCILDR